MHQIRTETIGHDHEKRILLVDDDRSMLLLLTQVLRKQRNLYLDVAQSGESAIAACSLVHYDLIISDLMMDDMNGDEVLRTLRSDESSRSKNSPFVLQSASKNALSQVDPAIGVRAMLEKPVDLVQLEELIEKTFQLDSDPSN